MPRKPDGGVQRSKKQLKRNKNSLNTSKKIIMKIIVII